MPEFPVLSNQLANSFVPHMRRLGVSEVARSQRGFMTAWNRYGGSVWTHTDPKYGQAWCDRRDNFVARHMEQFKKNPTLRRFLALVAWAYSPFSVSDTRRILKSLNERDSSGLARFFSRSRSASRGRSRSR